MGATPQTFKLLYLPQIGQYHPFAPPSTWQRSYTEPDLRLAASAEARSSMEPCLPESVSRKNYLGMGGGNLKWRGRQRDIMGRSRGR